MSEDVRTPRDEAGLVDNNLGWKLWTDMVRYYPSAVHRRRLIAKWAAPLQPRTVLDVGCGPGYLLDVLHVAFPQASMTGADCAAEVLERNRTYRPWCRFEVIDLGKGRVPGRFELVVCSEVLEHVTEGESALTNLVEMTGRYLLLTVPAGPLYALEAGFGHHRHYQLAPLCAGLEALGLRIVRATAWGFPWMTLFKRMANLRPQSTLDSFGAGSWSWPKRALGALLTWLFYLNLPGRGPQLLVLAERPPT
ncbi:MAG: class I SAM-dependent methyltransferase [Planctomycetes bacterium]|nr:class I SAM-dependent methyltransferase [Planctomycetota bacterium]